MAVTLCDTCHSHYVRVSCGSSFLLSILQSLFNFLHSMWLFNAPQMAAPHQFEFVCDLFNDTVSKSQYVVFNCRMITE
jgi:hypothetical protein